MNDSFRPPYNATLPSDFPLLANTGWKQATLALVVIINFFAIAVVAVAVWNRKYGPIKSKQLDLLSISLIGTVWFSIGSITQYQMVDPVGIFSHCMWMLWWANGPFGLFLYLVVILLRMQRLYFLMVLVETPKGYRFWVPILAPYVCAFLMFSYAAIFPWSLWYPYPIAFSYSNNLPGCEALSTFTLGLAFVWPLIQVIQGIVLSRKISKVRRSFNEFKEMQIIFGFCILGLVSVLVVNCFGPTANTAPAKIFLCLIPPITMTIGIYLPLLPPVLGFFFNHDAYLLNWRRGITDESLKDTLGTASMPLASTSSHVKSGLEKAH